MKKKLNDLDRYNYLFEFQIKSGVNERSKSTLDEDEVDKTVLSNLNKAMGEETDESDIENEDIKPVENKADIKVDETPDTTDDAVLNLLKTQSNKIDKLFDYINRVVNITKTNKMEIDSIQQVIEPKLDNIEKRVEKLEPPLPIEQLNKMVKISGGKTPDEYWSDFLKRNGVSAENPNVYYNSEQYHQNQKGQNNTIGRRITDDDIKQMM